MTASVIFDRRNTPTTAVGLLLEAEDLLIVQTARLFDA
jgi:hypothetical protein